jgi:hypothetical protein
LAGFQRYYFFLLFFLSLDSLARVDELAPIRLRGGHTAWLSEA